MLKVRKTVGLSLMGLLLFTGCAPLSQDRSQPQALSSELTRGIFALGPASQGFEEVELTHGHCPDGQPAKVTFENLGLCGTGQAYTALDQTWADPDIEGVYVRLPWKAVHVAPGHEAQSFDFSTLDHEFEQAVKYGKRVSLSFSAGKDDSPDWLFTEGGVQAYEFQDGGSNLEAGQCGARMTLGDPTDEDYQRNYFDLIQGVGEHLQKHPDWLKTLAYFKISGANLFTQEFRLPTRCEPGCPICNTEVWKQAGYTSEGIYAFVLNEMEAIQDVLPGVPMVFQLIQGGLPDVDGVKSTDQVTEIIQRGSEAYGDLFVVAHNGLGPTGKPNNWVINAGKDGQPTGFQTQNLSDISTTAQLQATLENFWEHSDGLYLEAYEEILWLARQQGGALVPDEQAETNTLAEWNEKMQSR